LGERDDLGAGLHVGSSSRRSFWSRPRALTRFGRVVALASIHRKSWRKSIGIAVYRRKCFAHPRAPEGASQSFAFLGQVCRGSVLLATSVSALMPLAPFLGYALENPSRRIARRGRRCRGSLASMSLPVGPAFSSSSHYTRACPPCGGFDQGRGPARRGGRRRPGRRRTMHCPRDRRGLSTSRR